ncbi:uncharacterized protein LOC141624234 [Silene latifolia]|uniref:uncharacterized protein LOC141624234 n=1 Tax=Silene latifolia TaxID=37657 RepID=UPI003D779838
MVFLCETKLSGREMRTVRAKFDGYEGMEVDSVGRSGGLAFWWKKGLRCEFVSASVHYMDFVVRDEGGDWRVTGFYGWPAVSDRHLSWQLLRILGRQSGLPWMCVGDFNEILFANEMKGGTRAQWQMNNFREAVDVCGLVDIQFEGYAFTWDNGQAGEANRQCRIDRAMGTNEWLDRFPYARLIHLEREWSDHSPIKLVLDRREGKKEYIHKFRFEQMWAGEEGCEDAIRRGVERGGGEMMNTLSSCAKELQSWKKTSIGKIVKAIATKRRQIAKLNEGGRTVAEVQRRRKLVSEVAELCRQEEIFWRQRSRALWLKEGDRNTGFFHRQAGQRRTKNHIGKLVDDGGVVRVGEEGVSRVATNYFEGLFKATGQREFGDIFNGVAGRVTEDMNAILQRDFQEDEVLEALNQMHPLKAPGPDGMNGLFYQTYWHVVGPLVTKTVLGFLKGEPMSEELNHTHIVLIPKKKAPDKIQDFRPISLCNVGYKLISKVLANRLKIFLGDIVSENQSAFTPGRLISDNVLIAFELFHHMKLSKSSSGAMAVKLDMAKAYDRVEWDFLRGVLRAMGFDRHWVGRVMECVSTVSSAVLINGTAKEVFKPERGLRQGDPLSPYLFILCAEVLSSLVRRAVESNTLRGFRIATNAPLITHLFFADDSIFFLRAGVTEAEQLSAILRKYEQASGQLVNLDKTTVSYSKGVSEERRLAITERLGVRMVEEHDRYLGLPTVIGKSKKPVLDIIRNKLNKRLQGWRGKILSRAGREILIKAVANSIPTYVMSIFQLPAAFCDELRGLVSRFWWGSEDGRRKISWVAWKRLCKPKSMGGMGFRDFLKTNQALLGKQAWRLITSPDCLWARLMRSKYYENASFLEARFGHNPSYTWRGILGARKVVELGLRRRIGDGADTYIWKDAWIVGTQTGRVISPCFGDPNVLKVADLMLGNGGGWDEQKLATYLLPFEQERVRNIRLSTGQASDSWLWCFERDGIYTVKSAYRLLEGDNLNAAEPSSWEKDKWIWSRLWKSQVWPRIKLFFWQLCHDAIATKVNLAKRIECDNVMCPMCFASIETGTHLFRDCFIAQGVWEELHLTGREEQAGDEVRDWVEGWWRDMLNLEQEKMMVACWAIWEARNKTVFEGVRARVEQIVRRVEDVLAEIAGNGGDCRDYEGAGRGRTGESCTEWRAPEHGWVKINVDAGVKEGLGVGVGAVCRNAQGKVLWGLSINRKEVWEPHVAEAVAVLEGLVEAVRAGHDLIVVESDCSRVVDALKTRKSGRSSFFLVLDDIFRICSSFVDVIWSHTSRNNNEVAHALAHVSPGVVGKTVWIDQLPSVAEALLVSK